MIQGENDDGHFDQAGVDAHVSASAHPPSIEVSVINPIDDNLQNKQEWRYPENRPADETPLNSTPIKDLVPVHSNPNIILDVDDKQKKYGDYVRVGQETMKNPKTGDTFPMTRKMRHYFQMIDRRAAKKAD